nr:uncharacterized protein LOC120973962 [Aegilops tauschii subsp. strangulata]
MEIGGEVPANRSRLGDAGGEGGSALCTGSASVSHGSGGAVERGSMEERIQRTPTCDTETLAHRAAKRSKASTGDEPPASASRMPTLVLISPDDNRGEQQQEEPLRAAPDTPPSSTTPPRGVSLARENTVEPTRMEEEEGQARALAVPSRQRMLAGRETLLLSTTREDIDTVIEEVARDAEAKATKIVVDEAAKSAAEEAAAGEAGKGPAGESGEAAAKEATEEPAGEGATYDQPSSSGAPGTGKNLKVGDDLFVSLPGTASTRAPAEGEVFDDEVLAAAGLQVVDEPSASSGGSQEEKLLRAMIAIFQKLQALQRARQDKVNSRTAAVDKAEADFQEHIAQMQALAATLRCKDEEVEKLVAQRTQELEQKRKDTLDALALDHIGKVEKLELEREELKKEISRMTEERDTANRPLADSQLTISDKTKLLFEANDSINDPKLKLDGLEGTLSEVRACEETLNKALVSERQLRKDDAAAHKDYVDNVNLWIGLFIDVAGKLTMQLAVMGMPDVRYSQEANISPNARLTLFFERISTP